MLTRIEQQILRVEQQHQKLAPILYILLAQILTTISQSIIKQSSVSVFQMVYMRAVMICTMIGATTKQEYYPKGQTHILIFQGLASGISGPAYFVSIRHISLSEGLVINQLNTVWSQFMAIYILNEQISNKRIRNICCSFVGLLLITRPGIIFGNQIDNGGSHFIGCLVGLFASVTLAASYTIVKLLLDISSFIKVFYVHFFLGLVSSICIIYSEDDVIYTFNYIFQMSIVSVITFMSHFLFQHAITFQSYAALAPYSYFNVIVSLLIDIYFFKQVPQILSILGGGIIVVSMILTAKNI